MTDLGPLGEILEYLGLPGDWDEAQAIAAIKRRWDDTCAELREYRDGCLAVIDYDSMKARGVPEEVITPDNIFEVCDHIRYWRWDSKLDPLLDEAAELLKQKAKGNDDDNIG